MGTNSRISPSGHILIQYITIMDNLQNIFCVIFSHPVIFSNKQKRAGIKPARLLDGLLQCAVVIEGVGNLGNRVNCVADGNGALQHALDQSLVILLGELSVLKLLCSAQNIIESIDMQHTVMLLSVFVPG